MDKHDRAVDREMLLAEFAALRAEILHRSNLSWSIFALQLTAAGVVFSFALSNPSHTGFLLILPVISYALAGRYVSQSIATRTLGAYIREVLEVRANGALHWETWNSTRTRGELRVLNWVNPYLLVFPGPAVIALAWVGPYVWESHTSVGKRILIVIVWFVGIIVTALSTQMIARSQSRFWRRPWRTAGNGLLPSRHGPLRGAEPGGTAALHADKNAGSDPRRS
jgi:hypothetical protein